MGKRITVLFDPDCTFCRWTVGWMRRLDWRHRLDLSGITGDQPLPGGQVIPRATLETALHVITPRGAVFSGYRACREIAKVLPATWPLVPLLYLPGATRLGDPGYRWVADHRSLLVRVLRLHA